VSRESLKKRGFRRMTHVGRRDASMSRYAGRLREKFIAGKVSFSLLRLRKTKSQQTPQNVNRNSQNPSRLIFQRILSQQVMKLTILGNM